MPWRTCLQRADECGDKKVCITCNAADNMRKNKETILDAVNAVARMQKDMESEVEEDLEVQDYFKIMIGWLAANKADKNTMSHQGAVRLSRVDAAQVLTSKESLNQYHIIMALDQQKSMDCAFYCDPGDYVMGTWMGTRNYQAVANYSHEHQGDIVEAVHLMTAMHEKDQEKWKFMEKLVPWPESQVINHHIGWKEKAEVAEDMKEEE